MDGWIVALVILASSAWFRWKCDQYYERTKNIFASYETNRDDFGSKSYFFTESLRLLNELLWLVVIIGLAIVLTIVLTSR